MKAVELPKAYDPKQFEDRIYQQWLEEGKFKPVEGKEPPPFTVVMPPPNVTGILHMGHALNNSLQDILTRYYRMSGRTTLWLPGTDHAGIATQHVVERQLATEGLRRQDLGRDKFLERTWQVKEKHHGIITDQLKKIGCSCDWDHERFTMDEGLSQAVRESFVTLYERGLIYKGEYLVNYCPSVVQPLLMMRLSTRNLAASSTTYAIPTVMEAGILPLQPQDRRQCSAMWP